MSEIFVVLILEDLAGDFPGGFFWPPFPIKMKRKILATKSAGKSGGSKIEICKKSVLPKTEPKKWVRKWETSGLMGAEWV